MVCKVLFFNYKDEDKNFFEKYKLGNYDIEFFRGALDKNTDLPQELYREVVALSVSQGSKICPEVISKFENLRVVATRSSDFSHIDIQACIDKNIAVINSSVQNSNNEILKDTFNSITGVLCGDKQNRIV